MLEIWDGYNADRTLAGVDIVRGGAFPEGIYHGVAEILVRHADGSYLVTQRDLSKESHPGEWEIGAGGSILKGENFHDGAMRELFEETGIRADRLELLYETSKIHENGIGALYSCYLCVTDIEKDSIVLQKGETIGYKWLSAEEIIMGSYVPHRMNDTIRNIIKNDGGVYEL